MNDNFLESAIKQLEYYKRLGEKAMAQAPDGKLAWQPNDESNSIATIVKHMSGNMRSRWSDFLTTDGEKAWRNRDTEFENDIISREDLLNLWNSGWQVCLTTLRPLTSSDLHKTIYIRNQAHTVMEAINRQLAHYPYHVGQIVFLAKMVALRWESLSIRKGKSNTFNESKFREAPQRRHFTDEFLSNTDE
jgi:hypothetical protein